MKYEGVIGSYSFQMLEEDVIEVWGYDNDRPESYIYLSGGGVKSQKDFDTEISYWYMQNAG
jgi:hypothetical protein